MTSSLERHLGPDAMREALEADVRAGLSSTPKTLPPKWFYDARGSDLFDQITRLPEYYPTRCESQILTAHADDIKIKRTKKEREELSIDLCVMCRAIYFGSG